MMVTQKIMYTQDNSKNWSAITKGETVRLLSRCSDCTKFCPHLLNSIKEFRQICFKFLKSAIRAAKNFSLSDRSRYLPSRQGDRKFGHAFSTNFYVYRKSISTILKKQWLAVYSDINLSTSVPWVDQQPLSQTTKTALGRWFAGEVSFENIFDSNASILGDYVGKTEGLF